jgi:predicted ATPase
VTYRPEFEPPGIGRPHVTAITINRLGEREIAAMIDHVAGNRPLPPSIRQDIIERTDGIPLFVEEITKSVMEAAKEGATERAIAAIPSPSVAVPASLHASLMARLDRLGPAKDVAQVGAAIGREFSHALLEAVANKPEADLRSALERLMQAGLLFRWVCRRTQVTYSNMLWYRTPPMAPCCASHDVRFMCSSPTFLKANSRTSPKVSPNC